MKSEMQITWKKDVAKMNALLEALEVRDGSGKPLTPDEGFALLLEKSLDARKKGCQVFLIGNGASASMASHVAADLAKNARFRTEVFTDLSLVTAVGNDLGYDNVFAEPLRRRMDPGDILAAISSSGRSPNVLKAVKVAAELGGFAVTLSAMDPDNSLRSMGDLNFYVPANDYGKAETCHAAILHRWIDLANAKSLDWND